MGANDSRGQSSLRGEKGPGSDLKEDLQGKCNYLGETGTVSIPSRGNRWDVCRPKEHSAFTKLQVWLKHKEEVLKQGWRRQKLKTITDSLGENNLESKSWMKIDFWKGVVKSLG